MLCSGTKDYIVVHNKLHSVRGKASQHNCIDCGRQAREWSWIHDADPYDVSNYEPRCRPCHFKYDDQFGFGGAPIGNQNASGHIGLRGEINPQAKLDEDDVRDIREMHATGKWNYTELATIFGVDRTNVSMIVRRKAWAHVI